MTEDTQKREFTCERCGETAVCGSGGSAGGCWCFDYPPVLPLPTGTGAKDCLCPSCLRAEIEARLAVDSEGT